VSLIAHTIYYGLIRRHPANTVAPLLVMNPLMTVALGIAVTGDHFDGRMAVGTTMALAGVLIITLRKNHVMPLASLVWDRFR
jgi:O-acetylserine/cysteine efflux transporter